ncbi:serine/threonine-protein kinase ATG1, partial [Haematococcus lacustris]
GGGDLSHYLRRYGRVPEGQARHLLLQLVEGLKVLRSHNLIHRDLKPQNLLLTDGSRQPGLKIADFGFARDLQPQGCA